jgi:hypothetical protein
MISPCSKQVPSGLLVTKEQNRKKEMPMYDYVFLEKERKN